MAAQQDCSPPYSYRPTFVASSTDCVSPGFEEHRSRGWAGGTFFRSKLLNGDPDFQGELCNLISIECQLSIPAPSPTSAATYTVTVWYDGTLVETYVILQTDDPNTTSTTCTGIATLRSQIGVSEYISMPTRATDIADVGGVDSDCLSPFSLALTGGSGGPQDSSTISSIRTGPDRTTIIIQTTEDANGFPTNPVPAKKVQQWDGSTWIPYIPNSDCHPI